MIRYTILICCIALFAGCRQSSTEPSGTNRYFNLKGFFESESSRMAKLQPSISKTVVKDGRKETRKLTIRNWMNELNLFIESDINKPAWRTGYKITNTTGSVIYTATDPALRTRKIQIKRDEEGLLRHIHIVNLTRNMLYESYEELSYIPDSAYLINKTQHIKMLGSNRYQVSGVIKP